MINELPNHSRMIFEEGTKANMERLVGRIITLAAEKGFYEFVPGFYLVDNQCLQEWQKKHPELKDKDFTTSPFWIMQKEALCPCADPLNIAEIILMTEGEGIEHWGKTHGTDE